MNGLVWAGFIVLILSLLALDLGVFHREDKAPSLYEALAWSGFWISLSLAFNALVYFLYENNWAGVGLAFPVDVGGKTAALEFLTGYLLEKSLSLDNIFVIALIFSYFKIPLARQHRVLFWGVLGAIVLRGMMIGAGAALITRFSWMTYVFGGLLLFTAARLMITHHQHIEPEHNVVVRLTRRLIPVTKGLREGHFLVIENGVRHATPLLVVLLLVETTDLLFALDSIPAIFAVTSDPFLVYSSNIFAILGLRSLYFALAPLLEGFRFLRPSLVLILAFVGTKMLLSHEVDIPVTSSLLAIGSILGVGILASIVAPQHRHPLESPIAAERESLLHLTWIIAVRCVLLVFGGTIIAFGTLALVFPSLGLLVIAAGLSVLAPQFVWARDLLVRVNARRGV